MSQAEHRVREWDDAEAAPDSERRASQRPASIRPNWEPNVAQVQTWAKAVGSDTQTPVLLIGGPTPSHRGTLFRLAGNYSVVSDWIPLGLVEALTHSFSKVRCVGSVIPHKWDLLWSLLTLERLHVEEPLRSLIDQGLIYTEMFKGLWEAKFQLGEDAEIRDLVETLSRWLSASTLTDEDTTRLHKIGIEHRLTTTYERLDMLFFLATLARHNDLLDALVFTMDDLEKVVTQGKERKRSLLKELSEFSLSVDRWNRLGAPVGFMLGYSSEYDPIESITRSNAKLGEKLRSYPSV